MFESPKWDVNKTSENLNKQLFGSKPGKQKMKSGKIAMSHDESTISDHGQGKNISSISTPGKGKHKRFKKTTMNGNKNNVSHKKAAQTHTAHGKHEANSELVSPGSHLSKSMKKKLKKMRLHEKKLSNEDSNKSLPNPSINLQATAKDIFSVNVKDGVNKNVPSPGGQLNKSMRKKLKKKRSRLRKLLNAKSDSSLHNISLDINAEKENKRKEMHSHGASDNFLKIDANQKKRKKSKSLENSLIGLKKTDSSTAHEKSLETSNEGESSTISPKLRKRLRQKQNKKAAALLRNSSVLSGNISVHTKEIDSDGIDVNKLQKKKKKRNRKQKSNLVESVKLLENDNVNHQTSTEMQSPKKKKRKHLQDNSSIGIGGKRQKLNSDVAGLPDQMVGIISSKKKRKNLLSSDTELLSEIPKKKRLMSDSAEETQTTLASPHKVPKKKKKKKLLDSNGELGPATSPSNQNKNSPYFFQKLKQLIQDQNTSTPMMKQKRGRSGYPENLRDRMLNKLQASRFRYLNEQLYTCEGKDALKLFRSDPGSFKAYHEGYQQQVAHWPLNPLDKIINAIKKKPQNLVIADFGCGDARLAKSVPHKVHSFDLVALSEEVTACNMAHTSLEPASVDIAVFCLSLMGTNLSSYILEANRVLKEGGLLKIADVESRFENADGFIKDLVQFGFINTLKDLSHNLFYFMDFKKRNNVKYSNKLPQLTLKPCLYKKR